uniref:Uncharacterized protein n=1 Tax=Arundo donax TaxID=35708 RepID=A0A0A8Y253_ARUDO
MGGGQREPRWAAERSGLS